MEYQVRNPRTGLQDYQFQVLTREEVSELAKKLRKGQKKWRDDGIAYRAEVLEKWKLALAEREEEIIAALTIDTGRRMESVLEAQLLSGTIDRWIAIGKELFSDKSSKTANIPFIDIHQDLVPHGLVGVISPWNFPLLLSIIDSIPALIAGAAVIVKPSEVTPRFIEVMQASIEAVPELAEVFAYIPGGKETGERLMEEIDVVCFTGSVATGKAVYRAAAENFIPAYLELGGKDPAVVLEGADLEHASSALLWGSIVNCGHSCLSIERIYVQESIYEEFLEKIIAKAKQVKLAYPELSDGQIGPVISDKQVDIINEHIQDALDHGAKLEVGESACVEMGGGIWCSPCILTNVKHDMKVIQEETFGPVLPIMPFKDKKEAIHLANDTIFGLSASVFAATWEEAMEFGKNLDAGAISVNDAGLTAMIHEGEKNAFKFSGIGSTRMGPASIKRFMRQKAFLVKKQAIASPWWFDA